MSQPDTHDDPSDRPRVVVGCDGTPESDSALRFAAAEARLRDVCLYVVTAYERPVDPDLDSFDIPDSQLQADARAYAQAALHRAIGPDSDTLDCHYLADSGDPARVLLQYSERAVMIVIGTHDRPLLQRLFGHLSSRELLHDATVPVTIVPADQDATSLAPRNRG